MSADTFNPFEDRLSRDIRNELSESLVEVLEQRSIKPAREIADHYLTPEPAACYRAYILKRLECYAAALQDIAAAPDHCLHTAAILWDYGLFFEVHEILEPEWIRADGDWKLQLQALIRAAGVYINLELGYKARAAKIAGKTVPVLSRFAAELQEHLQATALIEALDKLSTVPPRLRLN